MGARFISICLALFISFVLASFAMAGDPIKAVSNPSKSQNSSPEQIFNNMDVNKDEKVSPDEYAVFWEDAPDVLSKFKFFDKNQNGYIEREEYLGLPKNPNSTE